MKYPWWQFWKWHIHRCTSESDDTGCWGECIICHRRFGFVTRSELRAFADRQIEQRLIAELRKRAENEREAGDGK